MPDPCQQYQDRIRALEKQLDNLHKRWSAKPAPEGAEKSELAHEIGEVNAQMSQAQRQLADCLKEHLGLHDTEVDPCHSFLDKIAALRQDIARLSHDLNHGQPPPSFQQKSELAHEIGTDNAQIRMLEAQYGDCRIAHGGKPDLTMKITNGKVHLDINHNGVHHQVDKDVSFSVTFNKWQHKTWDLDEFTRTFDFNGTAVDVSVDSNFGTFQPGNGEATLHVKLLFHPHAAAGDGQAAFDLSSGPEGAMKKTGQHTLTLKGNSKIHENGPVQPVDNNPVSMTLTFTVPNYP
jgi:hypothetical protein